MNIQCTACGSGFTVDPQVLGPAGRKLRCAKCRAVFFQPPIAAEAGAKASSYEQEQEDVPAKADFQDQFKPLKLTTRQRADLIDKTKWSSDFEWEDIEAMARFLQAYSVPKGTTIFRQGDCKLFMGLVIQGQVDVLKEDSRRKNKVLASIGPEKTFGEMALVDGHPRSASALAAKDTMLFLLTQEKFNALSDEHPKVWGRLVFKIAYLMSQRLRFTSGELVDHLERG